MDEHSVRGGPCRQRAGREGKANHAALYPEAPAPRRKSSHRHLDQLLGRERAGEIEQTFRVELPILALFDARF